VRTTHSLLEHALLDGLPGLHHEAAPGVRRSWAPSTNRSSHIPRCLLDLEQPREDAHAHSASHSNRARKA